MASLKSYLTGFILSIVLTLAAYYVVVSSAPNALLIILVLAIVQLFVQLIFFLHVYRGADRGWNAAALFSAVSIILILVVGSIWIMQHLNYNMTPDQMNDAVIKNEGMQEDKNVVSLKVTPDNYQSFGILLNGQLIKTLSLKDIPAFDTNDAGKISNPEKDYRFSGIGNRQNDFYNPSSNQVYFVVYNLTTAGNANADQALFAYGLNDSKITLIDKRDFSVSFGTLKLSSDSKYLVFSDGTHGGICYDTLGLTLLNLANNNEDAKIFLSIGQVGVIEFGKWVDNSSFSYNEETYKNDADCVKNYEKPTINKKLFEISNLPIMKSEGMQEMK